MALCATCGQPATVIHTAVTPAESRQVAACPAHDRPAHTWTARAGPVTTTRLQDTPAEQQPALF